MSGYRYYEFCRINKPISSEAREEMASLSSRARITTHGASFVYNYGDFRGKPKQLLLKYFDVFFYVSNFGIIELIFKYKVQQLELAELKKYCIKHVINCEQHDKYVLLEIEINDEDNRAPWAEGENLLADLLPLYSEIKNKNYQILHLVTAIDAQLNGKKTDSLSKTIAKIQSLSSAQQAFLDIVDVDY